MLISMNDDDLDIIFTSTENGFRKKFKMKQQKLLEDPDLNVELNSSSSLLESSRLSSLSLENLSSVPILPESDPSVLLTLTPETNTILFRMFYYVTFIYLERKHKF